MSALAVDDAVTVIHNDQPVRATVVAVRGDSHAQGDNLTAGSFDYRLESDDGRGSALRTLMFDSEGWAWMRGHDAETAGALAAAWALRDRAPLWGATGATGPTGHSRGQATGATGRQGRSR